MSRLIDADALKLKLEDSHDFFVDAWHGFANMPPNDKARVDEINMCIARVVNAPTIDAVSVVRCKDCKRTKDFFKHTDKVVWCAKWKWAMKPNDFCSYGERRDHE